MVDSLDGFSSYEEDESPYKDGEMFLENVHPDGGVLSIAVLNATLGLPEGFVLVVSPEDFELLKQLPPVPEDLV